mmetsp:Transcript_12897/g.34629  ORF Transcript_12897/g.34629 Transcript_12897/m.34629 type:complete len:269 (+) Transcript_12897:90-896(+)
MAGAWARGLPSRVKTEEFDDDARIVRTAPPERRLRSGSSWGVKQEIEAEAQSARQAIVARATEGSTTRSTTTRRVKKVDRGSKVVRRKPALRLLRLRLSSKWASRPTKFVKEGLIRRSVMKVQSGVVGVCYHKNRKSWKVSWFCKGKRQSRYFPIAAFKKDNMQWDTALEITRKAAVDFRRGLEATGKAKTIFGTGQYLSGVRGVCWHRQKRTWHVRLKVGPNMYSKSFSPKVEKGEKVTKEAIEKARILAVRHRAHLEREHFSLVFT